MTEIDEIKKAIGNKNVVVGGDRTIKALKLGTASKIFLASNCKEEIKEEIVRLASLENVSVSELDVSNDELGIIYKKQFPIGVISFVNEK